MSKIAIAYICLIKSTGVNRKDTTEKDTEQPQQTNNYKLVAAVVTAIALAAAVSFLCPLPLR